MRLARGPTLNENMVKVLRHLAEHFAPAGVHRLNTPFDVPGLSFADEVAPALRRLAKAAPPYIEGLDVAELDYPVVVTDLTERGWEAAEGAGDARDAAPGGAASRPLPDAIAPSGNKYQVALSFAGEQRAYVQRVASALALHGIHYFYDDEQKISLWGKNLPEEFQRIYMHGSFTVVMFISHDYATKSWPIKERRSALSRALRERREFVLPLRFDDTLLPGLDPDAGYLHANDYTPEEFADAIVTKLVSLGGAVPVSEPTSGSTRTVGPRTSGDMTVVVADDTGQPVAGAHVATVARNGTHVDGRTDESGTVVLRLPARRLVTVYAAHSLAAPALVQDHDPANDLEIVLPRRLGVGSLIFESGIGHVPGLSGRLNPIRDTQDRCYLYADNISVNDQPTQPYHFSPGQPLELEDAQGERVLVTIVEIIGRSSLVRFES